MPDDKQTNDKAAEEAKERKLLEALKVTVTSHWNATMSMDQVAVDCATRRGESLFDRVTKCEAAAQEWEKDLGYLKESLTNLKRQLDGYPTKYSNHPSHTAQIAHGLATRAHDEMRTGLKAVRTELEKQKARLRKVKT